MTVLFVLVALAVVLGIGLLAVGRLGGLPEAPPDLTPDRLPGDRSLAAADVDGVRFDVGLRGYRMDEVDAMLDRVAADLAARDALIHRLRARLGDEPTAEDAAADLPEGAATVDAGVATGPEGTGEPAADPPTAPPD